MFYVSKLTRGVNKRPTEVWAQIDEENEELYSVSLWQDGEMVGVIDLPVARRLTQVEKIALALAESFVVDKFGIVIDSDDKPNNIVQFPKSNFRLIQGGKK